MSGSVLRHQRMFVSVVTISFLDLLVNPEKRIRQGGWVTIKCLYHCQELIITEIFIPLYHSDPQVAQSQMHVRASRHWFYQS